MTAPFETVVRSSVEPLPTGNRPIRKVVLPGQSPEGQHIMSVLIKRTYDIVSGQTCVRAEQDARLYPGDVFHADPMNSSVRYESDYLPFKLATDVVLNGTVYARNRGSAIHVIAELSVGDNRKRISVTGDRVCHCRSGSLPEFGDPLPFTSMALRYERAYGGIDIFSDTRIPFPYMRNPLGCGFAVKNTEKTIEGLSLPNFEDPTNLLTPEQLCCGEFTLWEQQPMPAGFGWFPKTWLPRARLAGIMPGDRAVEQELRAAYTKLVPPEHRELYAKTQLRDMDFRFFNGASSGLTFPFLAGSERIETANLTPEGEFSFNLPGETVRIGLDIGAGLAEPEVVIHTVMIRMDEKQVDLVWRGAVPYEGPEWFPKMRKMDVLVQ
jgi:hypothetical protein